MGRITHFSAAWSFSENLLINLSDGAKKQASRLLPEAHCLQVSMNNLRMSITFVLNEAEITLPPFLEDLKNGCAKPVYKTPEFADIRETPLPLYGNLADLKKYASMSHTVHKRLPIPMRVL